MAPDSKPLSLLQRRRGLAPLSLNVATRNPLTKEDLANSFSNIERIAEGGFSVVYKATQISTGKQVALKVIRTCELEMVAVCKNEYALLNRIHHPHIVSSLDFIMSEDRTVLVMSFFAGSELGTAVAHTKAKRLPEITAKKLLQQLLEALDYLHSHRIVHRDVKPENVMVSDDLKTLQLVDFNIARYLPEAGSLSPRCTPAYASPEIVRGDCPSEATDIWGAGLCLVAMLSGSCLVQGGIVDTSGCRECSDACGATLRSCLKTDPAMRPAAMTLLQWKWFEDPSSEEKNAACRRKSWAGPIQSSSKQTRDSPWDSLPNTWDSLPNTWHSTASPWDSLPNTWPLSKPPFKGMLDNTSDSEPRKSSSGNADAVTDPSTISTCSSVMSAHFAKHFGGLKERRQWCDYADTSSDDDSRRSNAEDDSSPTSLE